MADFTPTPPWENIKPASWPERLVLKSLGRASAPPADASAPVVPWAATSAPSADTRTPLDPTHFSTPNDGAVQNSDGSYRVATIRGVNVDVSPDTRDTSLAEKTAETRIIPNYVGVHWGPSVNGRPSSVTLPSLSLAIETRYGPNANPGDPSGYGRGTTEDDKRTRETRTIGFHEGTHGTTCQQYLRDHPLPVFEGRRGMTIDELRTLGERHQTAVSEYV